MMYKVRIDVMKKLNKLYAQSLVQDSTSTGCSYYTGKAYHYMKIENGKRIYNSIDRSGRRRRTEVKEGTWITKKYE